MPIVGRLPWFLTFFASYIAALVQGHVRAIEWTAGLEKRDPFFGILQETTPVLSEGQDQATSDQHKTKQACTVDESSKRMNNSAASEAIDEAHFKALNNSWTEARIRKALTEQRRTKLAKTELINIYTIITLQRSACDHN